MPSFSDLDQAKNKLLSVSNPIPTQALNEGNAGRRHHWKFRRQHLTPPRVTHFGCEAYYPGAAGRTNHFAPPNLLSKNRGAAGGART